MKKVNVSEYFGGTEPYTPSPYTMPRNSLEFDDDGVDSIAKLVFKGMKGPASSSTVLTKDDIRKWTKTIMEKKFPGKPFSEKHFERGFKTLDTNKDGKIKFDDIRSVVLKKVQKENLYVSK